MKRFKGVGGSALAFLAVFAILALGIWLGHTTSFTGWKTLAGWAFASFLFGITVGLSEILSRYRDEPVLSATTSFGVAYLILNGLISLVAFAVVRKYPTQIFPALEKDLFLTAVVAGFGAMAVFRSKFFTFRSADGKDFPIGPAIVLDTVLRTIDAKIDRRRATERQAQVFDSMIGLHDFENVAKYIEASLSSFQNLSPDDKTEIKTVIDQYRDLKEWPDTLKSLGLGFAFLNISGEENYDQVVANLKKFIDDQKARAAAKSPDGTNLPPGVSTAPPS
jgi:hypothetical protein